MKKSICFITIAIILFSISSCKKKATPTTSTTTIGSDIFNEGKGFRKVWGIESQFSSLGGYYIYGLTYTPAGNIHTIFTYGLAGINGSPATYKGFRKEIVATTGDTIATAGIPANVTNESLVSGSIGCLPYDIVPYTNKLVVISGTNLVGNPNWQTMSNVEGVQKVYDNQQALCHSFYYGVKPSVIVSYTANNISHASTTKFIGDFTVGTSAELTPSGEPLVIVAQKTDSLQVYNFETNTLLASMHLPLFTPVFPANIQSNFKPTVIINTKLNKEGTKIIGCVYHIGNYVPNSRSIFSTFIYDIVTKQLTPKIENMSLGPTAFYSLQLSDIDDDGNYYYADNTTGIHKVTPIGGDVVFKTGFLKDNASIIFIKCIMNKLFIAVAVGGGSNLANPSKGKMVIAMEE